MKRFLGAGAFVLLLMMGGTTASAGPTLTLLPSSGISALSGSTAGWGFTISNDTDYIEITSAQFCLTPVAFPACTAPLQGAFTDFISQFSDIVVGPTGGTLPTSVTQPYDALLFTGIGSFAFLPGAFIGDSDLGQIVLTYNVFDADPNGAGPANQIGFDQVLVADAKATVGASAVPEPGSFWMAAAGALGLTAIRRMQVTRTR